jgi:hypothetical protein
MIRAEEESFGVYRQRRGAIGVLQVPVKARSGQYRYVLGRVVSVDRGGTVKTAQPIGSRAKPLVLRLDFPRFFSLPDVDTAALLATNHRAWPTVAAARRYIGKFRTPKR